MSSTIQTLDIQRSKMKIIILSLFLGAAVAYPSDLKIPIGPKSTEFLKTLQPALESLDARGQIQLVNEFVDMALSEVSMLMLENDLDPMDLPDMYEKISQTIIITYWGDLNLTQGSLEGISSIQRNGDVAFDYTNRILNVDVPIGFETFMFNYHYKVKIMGLGPGGGVTGKAKNIKVEVKISIDFPKLHITLNDFIIENIGSISVKFDGNGLIDWLINLISSVVTKLFRGMITWVLENVLKVILISVINQINDLLAGLTQSYIVSIPEFVYTNLM